MEKKCSVYRGEKCVGGCELGCELFIKELLARRRRAVLDAAIAALTEQVERDGYDGKKKEGGK